MRSHTTSRRGRNTYSLLQDMIHACGSILSTTSYPDIPILAHQLLGGFFEPLATDDMRTTIHLSNHKVTAPLHALYIRKLSKELQKDYESIETNIELSSRRRVLAEIDILAEKDGEVHVYEVKKSYRPTKAKEQFRKIRKYYSRQIARFYLYCAEADLLVELSV